MSDPTDIVHSFAQLGLESAASDANVQNSATDEMRKQLYEAARSISYPELHINSMPHVVLYKIFSKLTMAELFLASGVCQLWLWYQQEITTKMQSLTVLCDIFKETSVSKPDSLGMITKFLFDDEHLDKRMAENGIPITIPEMNRVRFPGFSCYNQQLLLDAFTSITSLEIAVDGIDYEFTSSINLFIELFEQWAPKLVSLKLFFRFTFLVFVDIELAVNDIVRLIVAINMMTRLEYLTLGIDSGNVDGFLAKHQLDLPILAQLREFCFVNFSPYSLLSSMKKYITPESDIQLRASSRDSSFNIQTWIWCKIIHQEIPHILFKFTQIPKVRYDYNHHYKNVQFDLLHRSISAFTSLTTLNFDNSYFNYSIKQLVNLFAPLTKLIHLKLYPIVSMVERRNQYPPEQPLPQLISVQSLSIAGYVSGQNSLSSIPWAHIFPNLKLIQLDLKLDQRLNFDQLITGGFGQFSKSTRIFAKFTIDYTLVEFLRILRQKARGYPYSRRIETIYNEYAGQELVRSKTHVTE